jgi:hypothetical protein
MDVISDTGLGLPSSMSHVQPDVVPFVRGLAIRGSTAQRRRRLLVRDGGQERSLELLAVSGYQRAGWSGTVADISLAQGAAALLGCVLVKHPCPTMVYESRLELRRMLWADFDPEVRHIVARPFLIRPLWTRFCDGAQLILAYSSLAISSAWSSTIEWRQAVHAACRCDAALPMAVDPFRDW